MLLAKFQKKISLLTEFLKKYVDRFWYPPLLGFLAALDNIVIFIPNEGLLISSSMIFPRRWFWLALNVAIGSTYGAIALAILVKYQGLPWILSYYPGINETKTWIWSMELFDQYGLILVFIVALTPVIQQPAIILASLAHTSFVDLAGVIFLGRFIKYLIMAYVGSHAPQLIKRMWGLKGELKDVGVKIE